MDKKLTKTQWDGIRNDPVLHKAHLHRRRNRKRENADKVLTSAGVDVNKLDSGICASMTCTVILNNYNSSNFCSIHESKIVTPKILKSLKSNNCEYIIRRAIKKQQQYIL